MIVSVYDDLSLLAAAVARHDWENGFFFDPLFENHAFLNKNDDQSETNYQHAFYIYCCL
jgi:hypothetical protein